ncbi:hypothetical protein T265_04978 [Opisthorchis viverrini]|uniref:Uncharacterized protein n=1 Tax=Opisthorchis viverrini TaxID=6198 RepID=A0A074ZQR3_OPIVI|nr:hypothetical protein T265_04978 [Opisthorchis viverrini]KER28147.1 hypothetical protein T265_04978 [Opisthorchis viverrini]
MPAPPLIFRTEGRIECVSYDVQHLFQVAYDFLTLLFPWCNTLLASVLKVPRQPTNGFALLGAHQVGAVSEISSTLCSNWTPFGQILSNTLICTHNTPSTCSASQPCIKPRQRESALIKVIQRPRNLQHVTTSYQIVCVSIGLGSDGVLSINSLRPLYSRSQLISSTYPMAVPGFEPQTSDIAKLESSASLWCGLTGIITPEQQHDRSNESGVAMNKHTYPAKPQNCNQTSVAFSSIFWFYFSQSTKV